ncbi:MAG: Hpt domain-containing protein [Ruminiclostridium sp.]|nr:Hpt domain-containing protein [Ruminiclostridium sp.]
MITIDNLRKFGANVDEGVKRCLDDEDFYIDLVKSAIPDTRIDELEQCINNGELDKAFEIAHALKGMYGNISLTPIYEPINEMTELLRDRKEADYSPYLNKAKEQKKNLVELYNARK